MNDDWRLQIDPREDDHAGPLVDRLDARELEHDLSEAFSDRVVLSRDGSRVFLYAGTREQIEAARELIEGLSGQHEWALDSELRHWHPDAEQWEDPENPLPQSAGAREAEHEEAIASEHESEKEQGYPEFEVRVEFPSHHDAVRFDQQLNEEGLPSTRRWRYLLIGADDEDGAEALAARLREEAPPGSEVKVEGTWKSALAERPSNPFAIFGGLGG
ncbi:MAG: hypothetical protein WB507_02275 [Solirubrobacterales bacterium]